MALVERKVRTVPESVTLTDATGDSLELELDNGRFFAWANHSDTEDPRKSMTVGVVFDVDDAAALLSFLTDAVKAAQQ